jgi:hypothetical protein
MYIPFTIRASLSQRNIFNFRLEPEVLDRLLPASYLKPQVIKGSSVLSFCVLELRDVILSPFPSFLGFGTTSCAFRSGIIDRSGGRDEPAVYITDRNSDLPIISRLSPWLLSDTIPTIRPSITRKGDVTSIRVHYLDGQRLFSADARPSKSPTKTESQVFESSDDFTNFIHNGVTSYTPSIYGDSLARVDLHKEGPPFIALEATVDSDWLESIWRDAGLVFDSAFRATAGFYKWTYRGLSLIDPKEQVLHPERSRQKRLSAQIFRGLRRVAPDVRY